MSPILFLIYLSGVFQAVEEVVLGVSSLSFIDNLGFIAEGGSAKEVATTLEKVAAAVIEWGLQNAVSYNIDKIEAVLFTKAKPARLRDIIQRTKITVGPKTLSFNKEATR